MTTQGETAKRPNITIIEWMVAGVILVLMGIRLTSVVLLVILIVLYAAYPLYRSRKWLIAGFVAYTASLILPIDIAYGGLTGEHYGSLHSGPRFVHCVGTCLPRETALRRKYGEFATHISAGPPLGPRWVFVWD